MGQAPPPKRVLAIGWNSAGKTAVVQRIKGRSSEPMPTTGVLTEKCTLKIGPESAQQECDLELIDVGTAPVIAAKMAGYNQYLNTVDSVIFVLEVTRTQEKFKPEELQRQKELVKKIADEPEVRDKPFLVLANKCDREDAIPIPEVVEMFGLEDIFKNKTWQIQKCSAITAEGLKPGMAWLVSKMLEQESRESAVSGRGTSSGVHATVIR
mmetsp:Transcript_59299/g.94134  ORF Transcript_59299/g.94134 Transcript_59299/m.94134 type:complete len:210 (+) Transcript_59299:127-756(+)